MTNGLKWRARLAVIVIAGGSALGVTGAVAHAGGGVPHSPLWFLEHHDGDDDSEGAKASALDLPGVLTVSQSEATGGDPSSKATSLKVLGAPIGTSHADGDDEDNDSVDLGGCRFGVPPCVSLFGRSVDAETGEPDNADASSYAAQVDLGFVGVTALASAATSSDGCDGNSEGSAVAILHFGRQSVPILAHGNHDEANCD